MILVAVSSTVYGTMSETKYTNTPTQTSAQVRSTSITIVGILDPNFLPNERDLFSAAKYELQYATNGLIQVVYLDKDLYQKTNINDEQAIEIVQINKVDSRNEKVNQLDFLLKEDVLGYFDPNSSLAIFYTI